MGGRRGAAALANPELAAQIVATSPEDLVIARLLNATLRQALATLHPSWQFVLVAVYLENQPYSSVAAELGLSLAATHQLAQRARAGMRRALDDVA